MDTIVSGSIDQVHYLPYVFVITSGCSVGSSPVNFLNCEVARMGYLESFLYISVWFHCIFILVMDWMHPLLSPSAHFLTSCVCAFRL
jgi:hypothetical protein